VQIGPYQVLRELARGGMGVVYLAQGPTAERVAIKLMLPVDQTDPELCARFHQEAEALQALDHPGILRVRGYGVEQSRPYLVLDLLEGPTLHRCVDTSGPLPEPRVIELGQRLAAALSHAHGRGIVHRDLKPENVILEGDRPVIVDFGLARALNLDTSRLTATGMVLGTPNFMAPEQASGDREAGPLCDVYALGATLYFLLTGRPPVEGAHAVEVMQRAAKGAIRPPRELRRDLSPALEAVVLRCLAKDPGERYAAAVDVEDALSWLHAAPSGGGRRGRYAVLAAAALTLGVGGWALTRSSPPPKPGASSGDTRDDRDGDGDGSPDDLEPGDAERAAALVDEARALFRAGELSQARALLERALRLDPQNPLAYAGRGTLRLRMGEGEAAVLEDFQRGLDLAPDNPKLLANRGVALAHFGRAAEGLADLDRALEIDGSDPGLYGNRAQLHLLLGDHAASLRDLERAFAGDPENAELLLRMGLVKVAQQEFTDALVEFERALALDPDYAAAYCNRAAAQLRLERYPEALADCERALELEPDFAEAHLNMAKAYAGLDRNEEANAAFARALELDPRQLTAWRGLVHARTGLGDRLGAIEACTNALRWHPNVAVLFAERGRLLAEQGRAGEGLEDFERAVALKPNDARHLLNRGQCLLREGRLGAALVDYDRALELDPANPQAYYNRGALRALKQEWRAARSDFELALQHARSPSLRKQASDYLAAAQRQLEDAPRPGRRESQRLVEEALGLAAENRLREALEALERAVRLDPGNERAYSGRGVMRLELKLPGALDDLDRALELAPHNAAALLNRGVLLCGRERYAEAVDDFSMSLTLDPANPIALSNRGSAHLHLGDLQAALADFERALQLNPDDGPTHAVKGQALSQLGRSREAIAAFERSLELGGSPDDLRRVREVLERERAKLGAGR